MEKSSYTGRLDPTGAFRDLDVASDDPDDPRARSHERDALRQTRDMLLLVQELEARQRNLFWLVRFGLRLRLPLPFLLQPLINASGFRVAGSYSRRFLGHPSILDID
jgi:hypothetical protein